MFVTIRVHVNSFRLVPVLSCALAQCATNESGNSFIIYSYNGGVASAVHRAGVCGPGEFEVTAGIQ